jgi:hypothetical protein
MVGGTGGPADPPLGFGEPSQYITLNHVSSGMPNAATFDAINPWPLSTTLPQMFEAVANHNVGDVQMFTFSAASITVPDEIVWFPDFPGCDVSGEAYAPAQYGVVQVELVFEIFQARP